MITALALMIAVAGYLQYTGKEISDEAVQEASTDFSEDTYEISEEDIFTDTQESSRETAAEVTEETNAEDVLAEEIVAEITKDAAETSTETEDVIAELTEETARTEETEQEEVSVAGIETAEDIQEKIENPGEAVLTSSSSQQLDFAAEVKLNRDQIRSKNKEALLEVINNPSIGETQKQEAVDAMIQMTDTAERESVAEMMLEAKGFKDVVVSIVENGVDVVLDMGDVTDAKRAQVEDIVKRKTNIDAENIVITPIQNIVDDSK